MAPLDILNNRKARRYHLAQRKKLVYLEKNRGEFGGPPETRTPDPLIKSQLLYQLS